MSDDTPSKTSMPRSWRASHTASAPFERPAPDEDREATEEPLLGWREQLVAPIDRRPERLLPCRPIARAAVERQALASHPRQERLGRNHLDPRRGQFDGQRQPVERQTDIGDRARVLVGQREPGARRPGPLDEQPHGRHVGHRRRAADTRPVGNHQRRHLVLVLGAHVQARAARRQDLHHLAALDKRRHLHRGGGNVLEVVQDEQQRTRRARAGAA